MGCSFMLSLILVCNFNYLFLLKLQYITSSSGLQFSLCLDITEHDNHHHDHVHDSTVSSVSIVAEGTLDLDEVDKSYV